MKQVSLLYIIRDMFSNPFLPSEEGFLFPLIRWRSHKFALAKLTAGYLLVVV